MHLPPACRPSERRPLRLDAVRRAGRRRHRQDRRSVSGGRPGGHGRAVARAGVRHRLHAEVVVENRGGAGGAIASEMVARAPADGKTLYVASHGSFVINAVLRPPTAYDPLKAFTPIALVGTAPSLFIVRADYPAATLAEFIARAKQGTKMTYASAGAGTTMHIAGEQLDAATGMKLTHVPYCGAAPAINDLLGGHVDIMNADLPVLLPQVTSGKARALALAAKERTPLLPNLPTTVEQGLSGCAHVELVRVVRPGGTYAGDTGHLGKSRHGDGEGPGGRGASQRRRGPRHFGRQGVPRAARPRVRLLGPGNQKARHHRRVARPRNGQWSADVATTAGHAPEP